MVHGDDSGLRLPPRVAPIQVVIVPIWRKESEREAVAAAGRAMSSARCARAGVRVKADWREERPGFKYNDWELRGVPVRIEIGPRDAPNGQVVLVPRTDRAAKETVAKDGVAQRVPALLDEIQQALYDQALAFRAEPHLSRDGLRGVQGDHGRGARWASSRPGGAATPPARRRSRPRRRRRSAACRWSSRGLRRLRPLRAPRCARWAIFARGVLAHRTIGPRVLGRWSLAYGPWWPRGAVCSAIMRQMHRPGHAFREARRGRTGSTLAMGPSWEKST